MNEKLEQMPLYRKGWDLINIIDRIQLLVPENKEILLEVVQTMKSDASILCAKIAGGFNSELYDLKMENAAIIRKCARDIQVSCNWFLIEGVREIEYLDLLREEIEEFRVLFAEWVKTFDPWDYIIDRWGLFNPPGVNYDDKDPDEDLPFNNPFEDEDLE